MTVHDVITATSLTDIPESDRTFAAIAEAADQEMLLVLAEDLDRDPRLEAQLDELTKGYPELVNYDALEGRDELMVAEAA